MGTILLVLLSQAPAEAPKVQVPIAIVISSRRDTGNTLSPFVCVKLQEALAAKGIPAMNEAQSIERLTKLGGVDPRACDGSKLCLLKLAELLQGIVIGVDVGKVARFSAGHLEAVAVGRVDSVAVSNFTSDAKGWPKKSADEIAALIALVVPVAQQMTKALQPVEPPPKPVAVVEPPPPKPADTPTQVKLVPEPPPSPPPAVVVEAPRSRGPLPYVFVGATVAAAAVAIAMLVLASSDAQRYNASLSLLKGETTSSLTRDQLTRTAASANLEYSVALGSGIGAAAFAIASGYFFLREP